jgi:hypothetical protein
MGIQEPINCLVVESTPMAFRWRGVRYQVSGVIRSWTAHEERWNAGYFADAKFWLVTVKNANCQFELRYDPDGRWWLMRDRVMVELAA